MVVSLNVEEFVNLMGITPETYANGPGKRCLVHFQGCALKCKGCFNPESWSFEENKKISVLSLATRILIRASTGTEGLTISGGEPFAQPKALLRVLELIHQNGCPFNKGVIIFSGFNKMELEAIPEYKKISVYVDLIISGRYEEDKRIYSSLKSSSNQEYIWNPRKNRGKHLISEDELNEQSVEIILHNGKMTVTGFPPNDKDSKKLLKDLGVEIKAYE